MLLVNCFKCCFALSLKLISDKFWEGVCCGLICRIAGYPFRGSVYCYAADINGKIFASGVCLKGRKKEDSEVKRMRNRRLALAAALLLAITSADGAALAVSGADFSSEEVAEAFDEDGRMRVWTIRMRFRNRFRLRRWIRWRNSHPRIHSQMRLAWKQLQNGRMRKRQQQTKPWFFQMEKTQELPIPCQMTGNW